MGEGSAASSSSSSSAAGAGAGAGSGAASSSSSSSLLTAGKTPAQIRFEEAQRKKFREDARKGAHKSYREKVDEVNKLLEKLPEHNDLFKIQYAGSG